MGKILEAFADEQLFVILAEAKRSPEHQNAINKGCKLQEKLEERLNDEDKKLLSELMDMVSEESSCDAQSKFIRGYSLGVLMTMEVMMEKETYFAKNSNRE